MKRVVIVCQTAPGGRRRLAEEALRLAAGLASTNRCQVDFVLIQGGLLFLEPEFAGSPHSWTSFMPPQSRVWVPLGYPTSIHEIPLHSLPVGDLKSFAMGADLVLRF